MLSILFSFVILALPFLLIWLGYERWKLIRQNRKLLADCQRIFKDAKNFHQQLQGLNWAQNRYGHLIDLRDATTELESHITKQQSTVSERQERLDELDEKIGKKEQLSELSEFGVFDVEFDFQTSEEFKVSINDVREDWRRMIPIDFAAHSFVA